MSWTNFEFPHSSFYDSNLQELLRMYKELNENYAGLRNSIDECLKQIENFSDYVDEEIQKGMSKVIADLDIRMNAIESDFDVVYKDLLKLKNDVTSMKSEIYERVDELADELYGVAQDLRNEISDVLEYFGKYRNDIDKRFEYELQLLYKRIDEYVTTLDRLQVINPFNGEFVDVQVVLNEIADYLISGYGLTAQEYDDMKITASQYDNLMISAINYSMRGFFMFFEHFYMKMRSPFTGKMETYSEIINRLVNLHKKGLTAQQYDELLLTTEGYDLIGIDAYHYDWNGETIAVMI